MVPLGRFDRCWSVIQPTPGSSVAIRTTIEGRIWDQDRSRAQGLRPSGRSRRDAGLGRPERPCPGTGDSFSKTFS